MKKITFSALSVMSLVLVSCGSVTLNKDAALLNNAQNATSGLLGTLVQNATSGDNLQNIFTSFIGMDKVTKKGIVGTWKYNQPGVAFTSQSALAQAGGEVVAATCKNKLAKTYEAVGLRASNTTFTFNADGTFSAIILGKPFQGKYTFDESKQSLSLKGALITLNGFTKKNADGISILFESKKILTAIQLLGAVSGNGTLNTISEISSNYDGIRVGFELKK